MTAKQLAAIEQHGKNLLAIFPYASITNPVRLCRALRRIELKAEAIALSICNDADSAYTGDDGMGKADAEILPEVDKLLHFRESGVPVFFNKDARGYALKIREKWISYQCKDGFTGTAGLHTDWGGYGIIAPEINARGE